MTNIIIYIILPAAIVAAVGLLAGIMLTIAARFMYVPVDERVAMMCEILPGANCGACGFAGCDDYASALGDYPDLSTALCPVGGSTVALQLSRILGVEEEKAESKVAAVMCRGNFSVTGQIMETDRIHTCKSAKMFYTGPWECPYGCIGLGDCVSSCKYDAIRVIDGVAVVDREVCVGCGLCEKTCPNGIIMMISEKNKVFVACKSIYEGSGTRQICENGCIGCRKCQKICRFDAIEIKDNVARITFEKCRNCGLCVKECPVGAIENIRRKSTGKSGGVH